ncbi:pantoate--beta-alanine ligase [Nevskia ramosa]|uniref:pantoate--beta-alanine ligase n=1 Tax=Nevskia ramosa TaxID=64002 RepID=UPI0023578724|nr:pantoate--beta-alanine ligase [Nevskia ramosa]
MNTVHLASELRAQISQWRARGERIALVPTMGNLHAGHLALVRHAHSLADRVVVTVFVNPLQFGPNEDFGRYPRSLPEDVRQLEAQGVDLVYAPPVEEVYVNGFPPATTITVSPLSAELEGAFRPGFFTGVATVVAILFNSVQPDVAVFGEKDWQQLQIVKRMVADLRMPVDVVGYPTERAADGLALSSRNQYLTPAEREQAPGIHAALQAVAAGLRAGRDDYAALCAEQMQRLEAAGFRPQYLEVRTPVLARPTAGDKDFVVLVAAVLGTTRLIDNLRVEQP